MNINNIEKKIEIINMKMKKIVKKIRILKSTIVSKV